MSAKIIAHANFAKGFRGGERQTQLLIEQLSTQGFKQKLLLRKGSELTKRCEDIANLQIIEINKPYILHLKHLQGCNILHAHETKALQFAYFAHKLLGIPYIVTRRVDNLLKNNWLNKKMYASARYAVALSKAIQKEILRISPTANTTIIPSAFSNAQVNSEKSQAIKKRFEGKFLIGNVGALVDSHKGQSLLIEAAKELQESHPEFHFLFLGRGEDEVLFKEQAKGLSNVTFEGFVDNVNDYIAAFDLFVFPSRHEGLGSILFDVMQLKVPIIATNVGGIPDIIQNKKHGILIDVKSSEIINAIKLLYKDKKLSNTLILSANEHVKNYSPHNMSQKYISLYQEIYK